MKNNQKSNVIPREFKKIVIRALFKTNATEAGDMCEITKNEHGYILLNTRTSLRFSISPNAIRNACFAEIVRIEKDGDKYALIMWARDCGTDEGVWVGTLADAHRYAKMYLSEGWETVVCFEREKEKIAFIEGKPIRLQEIWNDRYCAVVMAKTLKDMKIIA